MSQLTAQSLLLDGLPMNWLNFVRFQYILMLFSIYFYCRCFSCCPDMPFLLKYYTYTGTSICHQFQGSPSWHISMLFNSNDKTFCLVPEPSLSQPPGSRVQLLGHRSLHEQSTWHFPLMVNVVQFHFVFNNTFHVFTPIYLPIT